MRISMLKGFKRDSYQDCARERTTFPAGPVQKTAPSSTPKNTFFCHRKSGRVGFDKGKILEESGGRLEGARETWGCPFFRTFLSPLKSLKDPVNYSLRNSKGISRQNAKNSAMRLAVHAARNGCRMPRCPSVVPRVYTAKYRNVHSSATVTAI